MKYQIFYVDENNTLTLDNRHSPLFFDSVEDAFSCMRGWVKMYGWGDKSGIYQDVKYVVLPVF